MWSCDLFGLQEDTPVAFAYLLIAVYMQKCQPAKRWSSPVEERWSDWMLYSPESGRRGRQMGGGGGHTTTLTGFQLEKSRIRFKSGNGYPQGFQEFSELEALEIIHLQSHYLGSTEVNVVVEDFALVTEKSIKWTQR
ncbi:MAG TPA: hypothetical protein DEA90_05100 [Opitutae bacterium]|nr:hypothetical protein [Puniceicoccaceae bacterium]HBR93523.1 hypothetical protein [Opitutae bacterium]|tara:strand:- start:14896 stop:15306 length:411 start_codon:yes stop_codon:yes gene_type:complete